MTHVTSCVLQFAGKMVGSNSLDVQLDPEDHAAYRAPSQVITETAQVLASSSDLSNSQQTIQTLHVETPVITTQTLQVSEALGNVIQPCVSTITPT